MNRLLSIVAISASLAFGQDLAAIHMKIVKSAPFSAVARNESIQTLPDGNRITRSSSTLIARDSEGRTRREQVDMGIVFIYDPVSGSAYVLDAGTHLARRYTVPGAEGDSSPKTTDSGVKNETLGTNIVEGIPADGARVRRSIEVGQAGNERAIEVTSETWYSSDLQVVLSSRTFDPRTGEATYKLTEVKRSEPDHALFVVPTDYTIQDATGK